MDFTTVSSAFKQESVDQKLLNHFIYPEEVSFIHFEKTTFTNLSEAILLTIPVKNSQIQLEVIEVPTSFYDYSVITSDGQRLPGNKLIKHYRGIVKEDPNSLVAISFFEDEVMGLVATDAGNFNLSLDTRLGVHVFYNEKNLKQKMHFQCNTQDDGLAYYDPEMLFRSSKSASHSVGDCVRLYFEAEHDIYQTRGSIAAVESFITAIFNQVATLYQNENIETSLAEIFVWTSVDPYTSYNLETLLQQFQTHRTNFNGDLGQLLTFRTGVGGGLAAAARPGGAEACPDGAGRTAAGWSGRMGGGGVKAAQLPAVSARLDAELKRAFEAAAAANDLTPSQVLRRLIRDYVARYQQAEGRHQESENNEEGRAK